MKAAIVLIAAIAAVLGIWLFGSFGTGSPSTDAPANLPDGALVAVAVPDSLTGPQEIGKSAFEAKCAQCHGAIGQGRDGIAPPLVHKIYEPSHHGDMAFVVAAQNGVRQHHWPFGNMPNVDGVTRADILNIVSYVRALQRENGIE